VTHFDSACLTHLFSLLATTTTTTSSISYPDVVVISPKEYYDQCAQPVIVATIVSIIAALPVHVFGMITLFQKMNQEAQKRHLNVRNAREMRVTSAATNLEESEVFF
jgi:hypothetical protein